LRVQTRAELKRLQQELGTTTIHVTHDQAEAMTLGQRVAIFRAGRIEQVGAPLELYRQPASRFVAEFLGSPAMNMWSGVARDRGGVETAGTTVALSPSQHTALGGAARVDVGVRPEDIQLATAPAPGRVEARVVVVEPVGHETLVTLDSAGERVVARGGPELAAGPGQPLWFSIASGRAMLFDHDSGARLG
jgi:ABC-type sugar transport system ATPase subunit